jgi:O-antigen/teichoic acid export membrane protein
MSHKKHYVAPKTWLAFCIYFIIPLCSLLLILTEYPEIPSARIYARIYWVIPTALVIVLLSQLGSYYQKGETKRFVLNIGVTFMTMIWVLGLLGGGLVMTTFWNEYEFSLHMDKYVLLIGSVAMLNILYYVFEWKVYRKVRESLLRHGKKKICSTGD